MLNCANSKQDPRSSRCYLRDSICFSESAIIALQIQCKISKILDAIRGDQCIPRLIQCATGVGSDIGQRPFLIEASGFQTRRPLENIREGWRRHLALPSALSLENWPLYRK